MSKVLFFLLLIMVSCKSEETAFSTKKSSFNVLIYSGEKIVDYNFQDEKYKNEIVNYLIKINKAEQTIQFGSFTYQEGKRKVLHKAQMDSLFLKNTKEYFTINGNKLKTHVYKTKYKRAWNDFATPSSSETGGDKYYIKANKLISQSKVEYSLDSKLTIQEN